MEIGLSFVNFRENFEKTPAVGWFLSVHLSKIAKNFLCLILSLLQAGEVPLFLLVREELSPKKKKKKKQHNLLFASFHLVLYTKNACLVDVLIPGNGRQ